MNTLNIDKISDLLREVAIEVVLPRFRSLETGEIESKPSDSDPHDIVTVVDHEVEEWLTRAFQGREPSVPVIGEEGVYANPELLGILESPDPFWLLDPIDGTKNFAKGDEGFGIMLARVQRGEAMASWIYLPVEDRLFAAELGSGAYLESERIRTPSRADLSQARGALHLRYMPAGTAGPLSNALDGRVEIARDMGCSAMEYTRILMGEREFAIYHRLHPWDHTPGALLLSEGGGRVEHLDGRPYGPRSKDQVTIVAHDPALSEDLRGWLRDVSFAES